MAHKTRGERLGDLKRNRRNRSLEEVQELLKDYNFTPRGAKEQGGVWVRGSQTLTLPRPHKGKPLPKTYIRFVIEAIEAAENEDELKRQQEAAKLRRRGNEWKKKL